MPENTLAGFAHAFDIDIDIIELDVLATKDGVAVVTHNPSLMSASTRDGYGRWLMEGGPRIHDLTVEQLQTYDVGGLRPGTPYSDLFPDQAFIAGLRIPTLDAVATLIAERPRAWLNLEIKSDPELPENTPPISEYLRTVLASIHRHDIADRVLLQSFDWRVLAEAARQAPEIPRSYLTYQPKPNPTLKVTIREGSPWMDGVSIEAYGGSLPRIVSALGGAVWSPYFTDLTAADVAEAHALGLIVNVWTVNAASDIDAMIALDVDGIITDYPGRAQRRLLAHGMDWRERLPAPGQIATD